MKHFVPLPILSSFFAYFHQDTHLYPFWMQKSNSWIISSASNRKKDKDTLHARTIRESEREVIFGCKCGYIRRERYVHQRNGIYRQGLYTCWTSGKLWQADSEGIWWQHSSSEQTKPGPWFTFSFGFIYLHRFLRALLTKVIAVSPKFSGNDRFGLFTLRPPYPCKIATVF